MVVSMKMAVFWVAAPHRMVCLPVYTTLHSASTLKKAIFKPETIHFRNLPKGGVDSSHVLVHNYSLQNSARRKVSFLPSLKRWKSINKFPELPETSTLSTIKGCLYTALPQVDPFHRQSILDGQDVNRFYCY
jgi:hypothetical protein